MRYILYLSCTYIACAAIFSPIGTAADGTPENHKGSLIPEERHISDFEARIKLARLLAATPGKKTEALYHYLILLEHQPQSVPLNFETGEIMLEVGDYEDGVGHLYAAIEQEPHNIEVRARAAELLIKYGAFYRAEFIYRDFLDKYPRVALVELELAELYIKMERYAEAEALYRRLLLWEDIDKTEILKKLAELRLREKRPESARRLAKEIRQIKTGDPAAIEIEARALKSLGLLDEAKTRFYELEKLDLYGAYAVVELGKIAEKENNPSEAERLYEIANQLFPHDPNALFYHHKQHINPSRLFWEDVMDFELNSPDDWGIWARLYLDHGFPEHALPLYYDIIEAYPDSFSYRIDYAMALAQNEKHRKALSILNKLDASFTNNYQIMLSRARISDRHGRKRSPIQFYELMHDINPRDPIPVREKIRTAYNAGMRSAAEKGVNTFLQPPVDDILLQKLAAMEHSDEWERYKARLTDSQPEKHTDDIKSDAGTPLPFNTYENIKYHLYSGEIELPEFLYRDIYFIMYELYPAYRQQQAVWFEHKANEFLARARPRKAIPYFEKLIEIEPGNQTAHYTLARLNNRVGRYEAELEAYERLLDISPTHTPAQESLKKRELERRANLSFGHSYWKESGRGALSGIIRNRTDISSELPLSLRHNLRVTKSRLREKPNLAERRYYSWRQMLEIESVLNEYVRSEVGAARKRYSGSPIFTGYAGAYLKPWDILEIGGGYERCEEFYNRFGLENEVMSNQLWGSFHSDLTGRWEAGGSTRYSIYNDSNFSFHHNARLAYKMTLFPRMLKVGVNGNLRHTKNEAVEHTDAMGDVTDITHPYWTPRHYRNIGLTLTWRHDISYLLKNHYYVLTASGGTDSDNSNFYSLGANWNYEFADRYSVGVEGSVYRSSEWDYDKWVFSLSRRF